MLIFWIYSVGLALFIKYANGSKIQYQASYAYCVVPFTSDLLAVSATLLFLITHVVVLVLLVFSYCSIFKTLYQVKRDLRKWLQVDDHHIKNSNTAAAINDDEDIPNSATIINNAENSINNSNMNDIKIEMPKKAILFARHLYPRLQHVPASSSSHLAFDGTHSSTSQNHEYTYYNDSSVLTSVCSSTLDQQNHHVFSHPFPASALSVLTASPVSSFSIPTPPLTQHASTRASPLPSSTKPLLDLRERILLRKLGLFTAVYIFNWSFMIYSHIFALFTVSDTSALIGSIAVCLLHFNSVCNPVLICLTDSGIRASFLAWFNISNSTRRTRGCGGGGGRGGRITKDERGIGGEFAFTQ